MTRDYRLYASGSCILLLLLLAARIRFSLRRAKKWQHTEDIKNTYRLATEAAQEGFFTVKTIYDKERVIQDFLVEDCNDRGASFMGYERAALLGAKFSEMYAHLHSHSIFSIFKGAMEKGFYADELKLSSRNRLHPIWVSRKLVRAGEGLAVTLRDISEAKAHELEITKISNTDPLTALPNRYWMMDYLPGALEQAKKNNAGLAILFIDLDNFKDLNDSLGHAMGDELLTAVATRLQAVLRRGDHIVRQGGDEFTVISEGHEETANISVLANRLIAALTEPFILKNGYRHLVGASIGISIFDQDGLDPETLVKHADIAMYEAKHNGKGRYQFYQPHFSEQLRKRIDNEKSIHAAMESDEFFLCFQPKVDAVAGELKGLEALIRWRHPERGLIMPGDFIPFAEATGLIVNLGSLVIDKACAAIAHWKTLNLPVVPVAVNVSVKQFGHGDLIKILKSCMERHGIDADLLEIELTESCMVEDSRTILEELTAIKQMGIKLQVDDFGTGYSSMAQLQKLDFNVLKIDQAFTRSLKSGPHGEALYKAMISMAHALGMIVVAEGVETEDQLQILQSLSCDEVQGYYIAKPLFAENIPDLLRKRFLFENAAYLPLN